MRGSRVREGVGGSYKEEGMEERVRENRDEEGGREKAWEVGMDRKRKNKKTEESV